MKRRYDTLRILRAQAVGKIRLGIFSVAMFALSSAIMILSLSAMSAHFAYASVKTVPLPPKRPNILSASPAYIKQLMARSGHASGVYDDAFSYSDSSYEDEKNYSEDDYLLVFEDDYVSLQNVDSQSLLPMLDNESEKDYVAYHSPVASKHNIPVPGHKPSYGSDSLVQRVEDFSDNPSSVQMSRIAPAAGDNETVANDKKDININAVRQPIISSKVNDNETALVSFTLEPEQVSLDPAMKGFLLEHAVKMFKDDSGLRMEIHAYASAEEGQIYSDVRRSLARALEVRSFLLEQNIDPSRLKLTPFGQDSGDTINNRIDLLFISSRH